MIAVALLVVVLLFLLLIIAIFFWPKSSSTTMTPSIVPAVLSPAQCRRIVERAKKEGLDRSTVLSDAKRVQTSRTSTNTFLSNDDPAIVPLVDLVERATGIPRSHYEDVQVVRYEPGQEYKAHYDACFKCDGKKDVRRTHTALLFLNEVEDGGHTAFPKLGLDVPPKTGTLIVWRNMDDRGRIIDASLHAGTPVLRGEKWACQIWIRDRPYR